MDGIHESLDDFRLTRVFPFVFRQLAGIVVEPPRLRNLGSHQLDDDVHRLDAFEVVGEVRTDTE